MTGSVRLSVGRSVSVCHNFLKGREVTLPCFYRSTCLSIMRRGYLHISKRFRYMIKWYLHEIQPWFFHWYFCQIFTPLHFTLSVCPNTPRNNNAIMKRSSWDSRDSPHLILISEGRNLVFEIILLSGLNVWGAGGGGGLVKEFYTYIMYTIRTILSFNRSG